MMELSKINDRELVDLAVTAMKVAEDAAGGFLLWKMFICAPSYKVKSSSFRIRMTVSRERT